MKERKVDKIDFIISETEYEKIIFRFRPNESSCHSHNDKPPTSWREVYKVYYSYQIVKIDYEGDCSVLYDEHCDECSVIDEVAARCKLLSEGKKQVTITRKIFNDEEESRTIRLLNNEIHPIGDGTSWFIRLDPLRRTLSRERLYEISMFKGFDNVGYRFWLTKKQLGEFGQYLEECCEYMLAHGDPI